MSNTTKDKATEVMEPSNYRQSKRTPQHNAEVVPFPIARRGAYTANAFVAADAADKHHPGGYEIYMRTLIERYRARLEGLGVAPARIAAEMREMESTLLGISENGEKATA
jgi:hypothetical protein